MLIFELICHLYHYIHRTNLLPSLLPFTSPFIFTQPNNARTYFFFIALRLCAIICVYKIYDPKQLAHTLMQKQTSTISPKEEDKLTRNINPQHRDQEPLIQRTHQLPRRAQRLKHHNALTRNTERIEHIERIIPSHPHTHISINPPNTQMKQKHTSTKPTTPAHPLRTTATQRTHSEYTQ